LRQLTGWLYPVTQSQLYWRKYREIQQAQVAVLVAQWDAAEHDMFISMRLRLEEEKKKEDIMKNALNYTSPIKKTNKRAQTARSQRMAKVIAKEEKSPSGKEFIQVPL
jgi:predicted HNH restriction endonuclease